MASKSSQIKKTRKPHRRLQSDQQLERLDSLPWNSSLPRTNGGADDDFSPFIGSNELEGGFLSLEEIDDLDYGFEIPNVHVEDESDKFKGKAKSKKRKIDEVDAGDSCSGEVGQSKEGDEKDAGKKKKKKKQKKKQKKKKDHQENDKAVKVAKQATTDTDGDNGNDEEDLVDKEEYSAWSELRLHPTIMKSIYRLKFLEPTPIQKACIPAAAHQGKDVIGTAETGSGKTLAFGLPILQRLLEEQDKAERILVEEEEANKRIASHGVLRALIITPTRELALQVTDDLKKVALGTNVRVVPVVGGMSTEKQERHLKSRPEIVVGTPGRLWELMSGGEIHLVELHSLSFFVLDEADRLIQYGHFRELQYIIDKLPTDKESNGSHPQNTQNCVTVANVQRKKRQTFVFSATLALSSDFQKKLKHGSLNAKKDELSSIEALSERAQMRANAAIVDLTNASILVQKLIESVIQCREEEKEAYLYYISSVHGQGRTIVFCTSIAALRRISSLLRILNINAWTLHSEMQQRARLKSVDHFRANEHGILVATDAAARGLHIPGVRTVVHYQLPNSAKEYVHRCGRTARASNDGCSIALISPNDASKFSALCKFFSKENFQRFPIESSYLPEIKKRISLAHQVDKIVRKESQEKAERNWLKRNSESVELVLEENDSEEERVKKYRQKKAKSNQLNKLQEELNALLSKPLQPKTFSKRYLAGAGVSPLLQHQFEELARQKPDNGKTSDQNKRRKLVVIGRDCVEPLQALKSANKEACLDLKGIAEKQKNLDNLRKKRKEMKKRLHEQRRKQKKKLQKPDA